MIQINNLTKNQISRTLSDLIEPFIVKVIQKENHTFFVYRCNDYQNLKHLLECHKISIEKLNSKLVKLIDKYFTAIDVIYFKVEGVSEYSKTKKYFDDLRKIEVSHKTAIDVSFYEVKLIHKFKKSVISVNVSELVKGLEKLGKNMKIFEVNFHNDFFLSYTSKILDVKNYDVQTCYGRKGFKLRK